MGAAGRPVARYNMASSRKTLALAALVVLAAAGSYGLVHEKLAAQPLWSAEGRSRLLGYALVYWTIAGLLLRFAPKWLVPAAGIFVAVYTACWYTPAWSGVAALAAVLYFLGSCFFTGKFLSRRADAATAILLGMAVWMFAIWAALHFPVNTGAAYAIAFAIPYAWALKMRRSLADLAKRPEQAEPARHAKPWGLAVLLFILLAHWLVALKPEISADGLSMHLALPMAVEHAGSWGFDFHRQTWSMMPAGGDCLFTAAYLLSGGGSTAGEAAARLLNFAMLALLTWMVARASRSFLMAALFASTPLAHMVTGSLFVENVWAALILGGSLALLRYEESAAESVRHAPPGVSGTGSRRTPFRASLLAGFGRSRSIPKLAGRGPDPPLPVGDLQPYGAGPRPASGFWHGLPGVQRVQSAPPDVSEKAESDLLTAGALLGAAMAVKLTAAVFVAPAALIGLWLAARRKQFRTLLQAAAVLAALAAPPYVYSLIKTGNPVFPFANTVFRSPYFDTSQPFADPRFAAPISSTTAYDITFRSGSYFEGQGGAAGFQYFLLLIPAALVIRRRSQWLLFGIAGAGTLALFAFLPNLRYWYPALPLFSIVIAGFFEAWPKANFAVAALILLNLWFWPAAGLYHRDFALFTRQQAADYLRTGAPQLALIERLNHDAPGEPVAFFSTDAVAGPQCACLHR